MHQSIDKKNRIIIYLIFLFILSTVSNKALKDKKNYSISVNKINISGLSRNNNLSLFNRLGKFFSQKYIYT